MLKVLRYINRFNRKESGNEAPSIDFENNEVSEEKMERLLEIIKKHNLVEFVGKYRLKNQKSIFTVLDGTNHYLTLKMSDGSEKQIDTAGAACTDLYAFFTELALETAAS